MNLKNKQPDQVELLKIRIVVVKEADLTSEQINKYKRCGWYAIDWKPTFSVCALNIYRSKMEILVNMTSFRISRRQTVTRRHWDNQSSYKKYRLHIPQLQTVNYLLERFMNSRTGNFPEHKYDLFIDESNIILRLVDITKMLSWKDSTISSHIAIRSEMKIFQQIIPKSPTLWRHD